MILSHLTLVVTLWKMHKINVPIIYVHWQIIASLSCIWHQPRRLQMLIHNHKNPWLLLLWVPCSQWNTPLQFGCKKALSFIQVECIRVQFGYESSALHPRRVCVCCWVEGLWRTNQMWLCAEQCSQCLTRNVNLTLQCSRDPLGILHGAV